jgi:phosphate transport system permease protein
MNKMNGSEQAKPGVAELVERGLKKRYRAERRFRWYGILSIASAIIFLVFLLLTIFAR